MSNQENNNDPKNHENDVNHNPKDQTSGQDLEQQDQNAKQQSKADSTQDAGTETSKGLRKPRGIGFLGRRGTAPIRTGADTKDDPKDAHEDKNSKNHEKKPDSTKQALPIPLGPADKVFTHLSNYPFVTWLFLVLLLAIHCTSSIWLPSVFFTQELHVLEVYNDMQGMAQWLIPPATEHIKTTFPAFYWFMALVDLIPLSDTIFLPLVASLTALMTLTGVYLLALYGGLGKRVSLASALLMLATPSFASLSHMLSPELFSAGLMALSLALLCRGWMSKSAPISFILGFLFLALATMNAGFLPLWTVLISSILFIFWRGTFGRANQLDSVIGFGVLVLIFAAWLVFIIIGGGTQANTLSQLMVHMISPFMPPYWPFEAGWYEGLLLLALGLVPWILLPIFASWLQVLKNSFSNLKAARKENAGVAWLYITLVIGSVFLVRGADTLSAIILYPVLIVLLAKVLCNLSSTGSNIFFALVAVLALLTGFVSIGLSIPVTASFILGHVPASLAKILPAIEGLDIIGGILLITGIVILKFTKRAAPCGALLVFSLFMLLLVQPFTMFLAPSLAGNGANYHALGAGMGVLPYGLGAPAPVIIPVEKVEEPITPAPEVDQDLPAPAIPLSTEPNPSSVPTLPEVVSPAPDVVETTPEATPSEPETPSIQETAPTPAPLEGSSPQELPAADTNGEL